jgi:predicted nucleic acid-binding protein
MIAIPDMQIMILLLKQNQLQLLRLTYDKIIIPTSYISEISGAKFDTPLSEGWLEIFDPDFEHLMHVDQAESKTGIKLSVSEESCLALALQNKAIVLTEDRENHTVAKLLYLEIEGISQIIIRACKSNKISKETSIKLLREIHNSIAPIITSYINIEEQLVKSL